MLFALVIAAISGCNEEEASREVVSRNTTYSAPLQRVRRDTAPECSIQEYTAEELFDNSKNGIAVVRTESGVGSAFVVKHEDNSTLLITNGHVVDGESIVNLKWSDGSQNQAAVVKIGDSQSLDNDLALLEVRGIAGKVLNIKQHKAKIGADIITLGAPRGLEFTITRGIVSAHREEGRVIQIDAPINPGNSGGPILDKTGCVVGVSTYIRRDSEGLAFGIASRQLTAFLNREVQTTPSKHFSGGSNNMAATKYPQLCWTSAHPEAPKDKLTSLPCKVTNPKRGTVIVNWSDGYTTKFTNYTDARDEIQDIGSGKVSYGEIDNELTEHEGRKYFIVNSEKGAQSWIDSETLINWGSN